MRRALAAAGLVAACLCPAFAQSERGLMLTRQSVGADLALFDVWAAKIIPQDTKSQLGLGPKDFAIRTGPGARFAEKDRLKIGHFVYRVEESDGWSGIVYAASGAAGVTLDDECGLSLDDARTATAKSPYRGACKSGWLETRDLKILLKMYDQ